MVDPVITIRDLSYQYPLADGPVLKDIDLDLYAGRLYGIVGANGVGKSTLCSIIRGFISGDEKGDLSGTVSVFGRDINFFDEETRSKLIGYVFQNPFNQISTVKDTVFEEIAFALENFGVDVYEIDRRVDKVMRRTNTVDIALKHPLNLSGGQLQRVAFASVLALDPGIIILDEPASQLDPAGKREIYSIIEELKKAGKTIILVDHDADLLVEYADEIIVLEDGTVRAQGEPEYIYSNINGEDDGVAVPVLTELIRRLCVDAGEAEDGVVREYERIEEIINNSVVRI